ncbi:ABC transporter substrate-binding protein [Flavobacteriaceae bacterium]|nr:ABC transporter substrate-binding protein [Flavobacteriaceae bacterium]
MILRLFYISYLSLIFIACEKQKIEEVNIGGILPLSTKMSFMGLGPSKAMLMAVDEYNLTKKPEEPLVNIYFEDGEWDVDKGVESYKKLKKEHDVDVLFLNNTEATIALNSTFEVDKTPIVNSLNNDKSLNDLSDCVFRIAKDSKEAHSLIGIRISELGFERVGLLYHSNEIMEVGLGIIEEILHDRGVETKSFKSKANNKGLGKLLTEWKNDDIEAYVFLGFLHYGFIVKKARDIGITAPFFGSLSMSRKGFFENSKGELQGSECIGFSVMDGNYLLAHKFLKKFKQEFKSEPESLYATMQAYDAVNIVLNNLRNVNKEGVSKKELSFWLKNKMYQVKNYQGVCGNLSMLENGAIRGIYCSLYRCEENGILSRVKR